MDTVKLNYPITVNGVKNTVLSMRRPTVGDYLTSVDSKRSNQESEVRLIADLCSMAPDDIKKLDMQDYLKLQDVLAKMQAPERNNSELL